MQQDSFRAALARQLSNPGEVDHLMWVYESLNKITSPELLRAVQAAGFEVLKIFETQTNEIPPRDLLEIFHESVLKTEQLVLMAKN